MRHWWSKNDKYDLHKQLSKHEIIGEMNIDFTKRKVKTINEIDPTLEDKLLCDNGRLIESNWHPVR